MAKKGARWTRDQLVVAFYLYFTTPFGKLHRRNPDIIRFAESIGRTSNAVAMKLVNFASLDEQHKLRGVKGLSNVSHDDRHIFEEFCQDWSGLVLRATEITGHLFHGDSPIESELIAGILPDGPTERLTLRPVRILQSFFRNAVLCAYETTCAICGLSHPEFLNASHIIPWSVDERKRADPANGLCLCVTHDRAFDTGFISVTRQFTVIISNQFESKEYGARWEQDFGMFSGKDVVLPQRFVPSPESLDFHISTVFKK